MIIVAPRMYVTWSMDQARGHTKMDERSYKTPPDVLVRIQGEFLEMPGLCLTPEQACRLWRLEPSTCEAALDALVDARFLARTRDGAFIRNDNRM
jgi:hypothetical protein